MKIIPFYYDDYDDLFANAYIVIDNHNSCVIIDPSKDYDGLVNYIKKNELNPKAVLLTHGHFDHIRGVNKLVDTFNIPFYIGFEEADMLKDPYLNCSSLMSEQYVIDKQPITVTDKEILKLLDEDIIAIHTPFHTSGSYCYYLKDSKALFSGDFLFKGSVGRSDLPTGNHRSFNSSISKILVLPDDIVIYPGHGPKTTLKIEKNENVFLR